MSGHQNMQKAPLFGLICGFMLWSLKFELAFFCISQLPATSGSLLFVSDILRHHWPVRFLWHLCNFECNTCLNAKFWLPLEQWMAEQLPPWIHLRHYLRVHCLELCPEFWRECKCSMLMIALLYSLRSQCSIGVLRRHYRLHLVASAVQPLAVTGCDFEEEP